MKGLNIKKLAAIAVGGALVGSALAPLAAAISVSEMTKGDVVGASGSPVVNVVAGSNAAASDFVWAGNIAAKVAQLATVDTALAGGEGTATPSDLSVDLAVGGSTTYSTEYAKTYDGTDYDFNNASNSPEFQKSASSGQLPFLANTTKSYRYNSSTYNIAVKESVGIKVDARFITQKSIKDLVAYIENVGDFNYVLDLGDGIPTQVATTDSTKFTDGDDDHVVIPFLGEEFTVQEADMLSSTKTLKLIKESAKATYNEGDTIPGLVGRADYAGEEMSVKLAAITQTGATATYQARFDLYDSEGNLVDSQTRSSGVYLNEAFLDATGRYALETVVYVSSINVEPTTSQGVATMVIGKNVVTIANGKQYPYDSTITDTTTFYWTALLDANTSTTVPLVNTLQKVTIRNNVEAWNLENPLWSTSSSLTDAGKEAAAAGGDTAHFLQGVETGLGYDFVKLKFDGFKQNQDTTQMVIGKKNVVYRDSDNTKRTIPFYLKVPSTPQTVPTQQTITIDNVEFYAKCYKPTTGSFVDIDVYDGNRLNGALLGMTVTAGHPALQTDIGAVDINNAAAANVTVDLNGVEYIVTNYLHYSDVQDVNTTRGVTLRADANCTFASQEFPTSGGLTANSLQVNGSSTISQIGLTSVETYAVYMDDTNNNRTPNDMPVYFTREGVTKDTYRYRTYYSNGFDTSDGYVYLLLDNTTSFSNTFANADVNFVGTDFSGTGDLGVYVSAATAGYHPYYWPDVAEFYGNDPTDSTYLIGIFGVRASSGSNDNFRVHVDTATNDLLQLPKSPAITNYTADVNYFSVNDQPTWALTSRTDTDSVLYAGIIDYGSTAKLTDDLTTATFTVPESQIYLSLNLLGEGATQTVEGGETTTGVKQNETVNIAGKDITVSAINYTAGTCTVAGATYPKIVSVGQLVYTDSPAPAGKHIIVGGYLVNKLAENVVLGDGSTLQEALTAPGDTVAEVLSSGNIVVAGYTAMDTKTAAQELIAALDMLA